MLKSLVIFAVLFVGAQQNVPLQGGEQQQHPQAHANDPSRPAPPETTSEVSKENAANAERYAYYKAHPKEYLKAAIAPTNASNWVLAGLGVVGGVLAILTLVAVKRQTDLFASKERGRLSIEFKPFEHESGESHPHVTAVVTNYGGTNAFIHAGSCEVCVKPSHSKLVRGRDSFYGIPKVIEGGESKRAEVYESVVTGKTGVWVLDDEILDSLRRRQSNIFAFGYIEYSDVFGSRWRLNFSRKWGGDYSMGQWFFIHEWPNYGPTEDNEERKIKSIWWTNLRKKISRPNPT